MENLQKQFEIVVLQHFEEIKDMTLTQYLLAVANTMSRSSNDGSNSQDLVLQYVNGLLKLYLNPVILEEILEELQCDRGSCFELLKKYSTTILGQFQEQTQIIDIVNLTGEVPQLPDYHKLELTLRDAWKEKTLVCLKQLCQKLLRYNRWILKGAKVTRSLLITLFIPKSEREHLRLGLTEKLKGEDISSVKMDDEVIYPCQSMEVEQVQCIINSYNNSETTFMCQPVYVPRNVNRSKVDLNMRNG